MRQLRPYQTQALDTVSAHWRRGAKAVLLVAPTGSGKTTIGAEAVRRSVARGKKCLWIAHRRELITQAFDRLCSEGIACGVIMADDKRADDTAPVQVCSIDTLTARGARPVADLVIWDEAHHCAAATWRDLHRAYSGSFHLGLTATPERGDGTPLGDVFEDMVIGASVRELTDMGFLVPCEVIAPPVKLDQGQLALDPVAAYQELGAGRQAVLYTGFVADAHEAARRFVEAGIPAAAVDGAMPMADRDDVLQRFASGDLRVVTNVNVLTEGWDAPQTAVCILGRRVGHAGLYLQMVGRVLRPAEGKTSALVIDLAGSAVEHGTPDEDRDYSLQGNGIARQKSTKEALTVCRNCGRFGRTYPCKRCGYQPERQEIVIKPTKLVTVSQGTGPVKIDWQRLQALCSLCKAKGHKHGWVWFKYKEQTGDEIPFNAVMKAMRNA